MTDDRRYDLAKRLVDSEVYGCVTSLIEYILSASSELGGQFNPPFTFEDVYSVMPVVCPECGSNNTETGGEEHSYKCNDCEEEFDEGDMPEIYDWLQVAPALAKDLQRYKEVVISDGWQNYWGRCTAGQSIALDWVIQQIAVELHEKTQALIDRKEECFA